MEEGGGSLRARGHACRLEASCIDWNSEIHLSWGGYGEVSFARCTFNGELVALKRVVQRRRNEERVQRKLAEEANILSALSHKNILKVHGWFICDRQHNYYIVMDYAENGSVDDFLDKNSEDPDCLPHTKFYIGCEVADGLKYLHEQTPPLVHRDLKPSNVLLGKFYPTSVDVKIGDFGLAEWKEISRSVTMEHGAEGEAEQKERRRWRRASSQFYVPPEYWEHVQAKPNEMYDVYSYGIMCWELLMEKKPFEGVHLFEAALKKGTRPCPLPNHSSRQIQKMTELIQRCWAQNRSDRPPFATIVQELWDYRIDTSHKEALQKELSRLMVKIRNSRQTVLPTDVTQDCSLPPQNIPPSVNQPQQFLSRGPRAPVHNLPPQSPEQETVPGLNQAGSFPPQEGVTVRSNYPTGPNPPQQIRHNKNVEYYPTREAPPVQRNTATTEIDLGQAYNRNASTGVNNISQEMGSIQIDGPPSEAGDSGGASGGIPLVVSDFQSPPASISPESNTDQAFNFPQSPVIPSVVNDVTTRTDEENQGRPFQRDLSMDASMTGQEAQAQNNLQETREPQRPRPPTYEEACNQQEQQQPRRNRSPSPPPNGGARSTPTVGPMGDRPRDPNSGGRRNDLGGGKEGKPDGQKKNSHKQIHVSGNGQPINITNTYIAGGQGSQHRENFNIDPGFVPPVFPTQHITANHASVINIDNADHVQIGNNNTFYHGGPATMHIRSMPKKPKTTKKVKITGSNRVVDDENMLRVAQHLGRPWKLLGRKMGFSSGELDAIDIDYQQDGLQEKIYRLLHKWVEKKGKEASYRKLADMLIEIKKVEVAAMLKPPERIPSE